MNVRDDQKFRLLLQPYLIRKKRLQFIVQPTVILMDFQIIYFIYFSSFLLKLLTMAVSIWLAFTVVINRYRTPHLTKILAANFWFSENVGLTHIAYIPIH